MSVPFTSEIPIPSPAFIDKEFPICDIPAWYYIAFFHYMHLSPYEMLLGDVDSLMCYIVMMERHFAKDDLIIFSMPLTKHFLHLAEEFEMLHMTSDFKTLRLTPAKRNTSKLGVIRNILRLISKSWVRHYFLWPCGQRCRTSLAMYNTLNGIDLLAACGLRRILTLQLFIAHLCLLAWSIALHMYLTHAIIVVPHLLFSTSEISVKIICSYH